MYNSDPWHDGKIVCQILSISHQFMRRVGILWDLGAVNGGEGSRNSRKKLTKESLVKFEEGLFTFY